MTKITANEARGYQTLDQIYFQIKQQVEKISQYNLAQRQAASCISVQFLNKEQVKQLRSDGFSVKDWSDFDLGDSGKFTISW